jgi:hypothetical protein
MERFYQCILRSTGGIETTGWIEEKYAKKNIEVKLEGYYKDTWFKVVSVGASMYGHILQGRYAKDYKEHRKGSDI